MIWGQSWPAMIGPAMIEFKFSLELFLAALEVPIAEFDSELSRMSHRKVSNALHVNGPFVLFHEKLF